jgi:hypothetical protein
VKHKLRRARTLYFGFLVACFVALIAPLTMVTAQQADKSGEVQKPQPAAAGGTATQPSFEEADRNRDGFVDKSEAGVVPGLSANFERADRSRDGKLDAQEFAKGLEILQVRR